jgi:hypothetical protein
MAITIATTGRLMKSFEIIVSPWSVLFCSGLGIDYSARLHALDTLNYYGLTRLQPVFHNPHGTTVISYLDWSVLDSVITSYDRYLITTLQLRDGSLRNQQRISFC